VPHIFTSLFGNTFVLLLGNRPGNLRIESLIDQPYAAKT